MSDGSAHEPPGGSDEKPRRIPPKRSQFRVEDDDASPIFEQESAKADFEFWARMAVWTLDEAVALSFERDPEIVSWDVLQNHLVTTFAENFRRMRKLTDRARLAGVLADPCPPMDFIRWAHQNRIPFSEQLAQVVVTHVGESANRSFAVERQQVASRIQNEAAGDRRSMNSLLKLVGGLAVAIYKYDPTAKKSEIPATIQSDLDLVGVSMDVDTIRKWIRLGVESAEIQTV